MDAFSNWQLSEIGKKSQIEKVRVSGYTRYQKQALVIFLRYFLTKARLW